MTTRNLPEKKKRSAVRIILPCLVWLLALCAVVFVFCRKVTPLYTEESLNSVHPLNMPELGPGDSVSQSFSATYGHLCRAGVAISYQDDIPADTSALVQIWTEDTLLVEQPFTVTAIPSDTFCPLRFDLSDCLGKTVTIRVENTSQGSDDAAFSLLATDKDFLTPDNSGHYLLNGEEQNARLLYTTSYLTGYSWYHALTYAFWIFLAALAVQSYLVNACSQPGGKSSCHLVNTSVSR